MTYTNFHVNSLCSPSRIALLTGRNQHQCTWCGRRRHHRLPGGHRGTAGVCATIGEILGSWGYVTSYFGKCHEVPPVE